MFENSLLTQINVENPLPTLVELEISGSLNTALKRAFLFFHLLAAEKLSFLAPLLPYGNEMYLTLQTGMEHFLLFNADTTFTELMFGLRRVQITGPKGSSVSEAWARLLAQQDSGASAGASVLWKDLRRFALGPSPLPSAEERAISYVARPPRALSDNGDGSPVPGSTASTAAVLPVEMDQLAAESGGGVEEYKAGELMSASRASYGYLRFTPPTHQQRLISLFLLTLKPYMEKKVKTWYMNEVDDSPDAVSMREALAHRYPVRAQVKRLFCKYIFPLLHVLNKSAELLFKVLYLCELTPYASPLHRLFNIAIKRGSFEENMSLSPQARRAMSLARAGFSGSSLLKDEDDASLPIPPPPVWGLDVRRDTEEDAKKRRNSTRTGHSSTSTAVLPSPTDAVARGVGYTEGNGDGAEEADAGENVEAMEVVPGQCPVCRKPITNAAVTTTTGVMGCYPCLQQYVREHRECPVTVKPTSVEHIRRVFEC